MKYYLVGLKNIGLLVFFCVFLMGSQCPPDNNTTTTPASKTLLITPSIQQTSSWCWATSAQMVLRFYNYLSVNPVSPQCGIVAVWFGGQCAVDCTSCQSGIGAMSNEQYVINNYGPFLFQSGYSQSYSVIRSTLVPYALSMNDIVNEISQNRPVIIGIAPEGGWALPNVSQHIAVLVGYDISNGKSDVVVNDPYPFNLDTSRPNPYLFAGATSPQLGQYVLPRLTLVQNMAWANTIYQIQSY